MENKIEKRMELKAPISRVWRALTDYGEFGKWFGAEFTGPFTEGQALKGRITHPGYEHVKFEIEVQKIEPEHYFSYTWHPYAIDPSVVYSTETPTLVEFFLEASGAGTLLRVTESGFEKIPENRRAEAFRKNEGGWGAQMENIKKYIEANK